MTSENDRNRLPEDQNWVSSMAFDRRKVVAGGLFAAGFAAACQPVMASVINTDLRGLIEENVTITAADGFAMPAYVARPAAKKMAPVIVVVHEVFGVHEWIRDICRRFAKAGYYAVAPDLFARHGNASATSDMKTLIADVVSKASDAQVMSDIDATYDWAGDHDADDTLRAITGFCWGGRIVWLYAGHSPRLDAGVAFYGRLVSDKSELQPHSVIEEVGNLKAPVLGQYGALDKGIPIADVEAMRTALEVAGKSPPDHITLYQGAEHGFMADYRASYNQGAAAEAWTATLGWFDYYLKG